MSTLRAVGIDELSTLRAALIALGATVYEETVCGSVGSEYAYEIPYEAEGDDPQGWEWTTPRVIEIPVIDDSDDDTMADTAEYGFINDEAA